MKMRRSLIRNQLWKVTGHVNSFMILGPVLIRVNDSIFVRTVDRPLCQVLDPKYDHNKDRMTS